MEESNKKENRVSCFENFKSKAWKTFSCYSQESSIHSMSYIGKEFIHWIERVFWIAAFLLSFCTCSYLIYKTYDRWQNDPMIVTFKEKSTPIWQIPYPAITICPESKVDVDKFNFSRVLDAVKRNKTLNAEDSARYQALFHVCDLREIESKTTNCEVVDTLREIQNDFAKISLLKYIQIEGIPFETSFKEIVTRNGICYTANILHYEDIFKTVAKDLRHPVGFNRSDWTIFGYKDPSFDAYPGRVTGSGKESEIEITLRMDKKNVNNHCKKSSGFRLTLHTPDELPQTDSNFYRIPFNFETLIALKPSVMSTAEELKAYKPEKRQCYFPGENQLKFFKAYTRMNCKLECFVAFVLKTCGCVRFSMPHAPGTKICTQNQLKCIKDAQTLFTLVDHISEVHGGEFNPSDVEEGILRDNSSFSCESSVDDGERKSLDADGFVQQCKCLPSCASIDYEAEISQSTIDVHRDSKVSDDDDEYETAVVSIYFKKDFYTESMRSELYGSIDFLSNCGGFLGLLMGGSFLSLIEILYHLTLRKVFASKNQENEEIAESSR